MLEVSEAWYKCTASTIGRGSAILNTVQKGNVKAKMGFLMEQWLHSMSLTVVLMTILGYMPTGSAPNVFSVQLQSLIDRESSYISALDLLRDAFWMPLTRRYLSSNGRQTGPVNHRRRFSLVGFMHLTQNSTGGVMRTLSSLFGYLPAIKTIHHCLLEELRVLHMLNASIAEVAALIRVRVLEEFEVYISQAANYSMALVGFENLCFVDDSFRRAVEECTLQAGGIDIRTLLRRPIDRVSQYISFFETVLTQCTEVQNMRHCYSDSNGVISERDTIEVNRCIETMEALVARISPW
ncbi:hypothetical protein BDF19DRAFT_2092 [Syncephalis fuscata]|nr:hypothetical protein BDF19DRAFT_2092 [Syncephalis fuscata]